MNEQEMIMNEKIRKREKLDTILAYILLVFLIGAILLIVIINVMQGNSEKIRKMFPSCNQCG